MSQIGEKKHFDDYKIVLHVLSLLIENVYLNADKKQDYFYYYNYIIKISVLFYLIYGTYFRWGSEIWTYLFYKITMPPQP